jgi:hypothetical protein
MPTVADAMFTALSATYPDAGTLADMLALYCADNGLPPGGLGPTLYEFLIGEGATGDTVVDARLDYWLNVYSGEGGGETFHLLLESGDALLLESGDNILLESAP